MMAKARKNKQEFASRPPAVWFGDHPACDFLNTLAAPRGTPIEWLETGTDLLDWLGESSLIDADQKSALVRRWPAQQLNDAAREAREFREWFRGAVVRRKASGAVASQDAAHLNAALARDASYPQLSQSGQDITLAQRRHWNEPAQLVAPIAGAAADLFCDGDWDLIRKCENPACTIWFYDRTKGHRRRWCSQAFCGNRAKVAAFRQRQKD